MTYLKNIKNRILNDYLYRWLDGIYSPYNSKKVLKEIQKKSIKQGFLTLGLTILLAIFFDIEIKMIILLFIGAILAFARPFAVLKREYTEYSKDLYLGLESLTQEITILLSAGINIESAISIIAKAPSTYPVMQRLFEHIGEEKSKGFSTTTALAEFSLIYRNKYLNKFNATILQSNKTGTKRLAENLMNLSKEITAERQANLKRRAEVLSTKLLMPLMLSLIGIMAMLTIPVFMQLKI